MDFLNKAFAQVADLFRSMTPGARITAGLLLAVVVVSLGYLFTYQVAGSDDYLMHGYSFTPSEQRDLEAAFGMEGLNDYEFEGTRIRIPRSQRDAYMAAARKQNALPQDPGDELDGAVGEPSLFEGAEEKKQRVKNAIQKELARLIESMPGIAYATVLYTTESQRGFNKSSLTKALVGVKLQGTQHLEPSTASVIRKTVAGAVTGLKYENVTLTDLNAGRSYVAGPDATADPTDDPLLARKLLREERLKTKILGALTYVPGIVVEPTVELDTQRMSRTETTKFDPKSTPYLVEEKTTSHTRQPSTPAGAPGVEAQGAMAPMALTAQVSTGTEESEEDSDRREHSALGGETKVTESEGYQVKRVRVVVTVPNSYFQKVWHQQNPVGEGEEPKIPDKTQLQQIAQEEMTKIRSTVAGFLPAIEGVADPTQLVTVTPFQDLDPEDVPTPGMGPKVLTWLADYWGTLGMIGLAVFSLVMLRSMVRAVPSVPPPGQAPTVLSLHTAEDEEEPDESTTHKKRLVRVSGHGVSLRDELSELVNEDPDSAGNILKNWIGSAG